MAGSFLSVDERAIKRATDVMVAGKKQWWSLGYSDVGKGCGHADRGPGRAPGQLAGIEPRYPRGKPRSPLRVYRFGSRARAAGAEIGAPFREGRTIRCTAFLFPVSDRPETDPERSGELLLG